MTDIVDPNTITNGDTPDWDAVQAYFDAIYAVINNPGELDNANIATGAGIEYDKLDLTGDIVTADIGDSEVTQDKIARPTLHNDGSTAATNIALNTWAGTGCTFTVPAGGTGLYVITNQGYVTDNSSSNGLVEIHSQLINGFTAFGVLQKTQAYVGGTPGIDIPVMNVEFAVLTAGDVIQSLVKAVNSSAVDIATNAIVIKAIRVTA
jgi:hypothetical protein